jgi:hypothetical protein
MINNQPSCEKCNRPGQLVQQFGNPAHPSMGIPAPWVFRYYLCRWHRAAWNRNKMPSQCKMKVIQYKPDNEVLTDK